jgi:alkylation response protein AidB-like acyl-CoA dehydrogenase
VDFAFSPEQEEFRHSLRRFLADKSPAAEVRRLMETDAGYDPQVWKQLADQLGLQGLAIPEEFGGTGATAVELGIAFEEMGRALLCAPFFSTVGLAAQALLAAGDDQAKREYLPRIADGSLLATVAVTEPDGRWDLAAVRTSAVADGAASGAAAATAAFLLDGTKMFVVDGHVAEVLLVVARTDHGLGLFAVDAAAAGVVRSLLPTLDMTRKLARVELSGVPARLVSGPGDATAALSRALDLALVALTAEQVGGAQRCLDMAVDYAKIRMQFGRPIGSFQAIKHKCAEMLLEVESARSAAYHAAGSAAEASSDELGVAAAIAKACCSEAYFHVAAETIQVHGGIGFTWEHDAHLYFRRAKSSQLLFGDEHYHRERFAALAGI